MRGLSAARQVLRLGVRYAVEGDVICHGRCHAPWGMMLTETMWRSMLRHRISFLPCCHATPRWSYIIYNVLFLIEFPSSVVPSVFFLVSRDSWSKLRSPLAPSSVEPSAFFLVTRDSWSKLRSPLARIRQLSLRPSSSSLGIAGASSALLSLVFVS